MTYADENNIYRVSGKKISLLIELLVRNLYIYTLYIYTGVSEKTSIKFRLFLNFLFIFDVNFT